MKPFKSKSFTDKSRGTNCVCCGSPDAYACHYNGTFQHLYGKGRSIKCSDLMTAEFCHKCDQDFSEGVNIYETREERDQMFLHWIAMTNIRRLETGVLKT